MNTATAMYALGLDQVAKTYTVCGSQTHHPCAGSHGLWQIINAWHDIQGTLPDHTALYFDCTTKDLGDITIPNIAKLDDGSGYVTYLTNEELGAHLDKACGCHG